MNRVVDYRLPVFCLLLLSLTIAGCSSLTAKYDIVAYQQATSLKVDALALMDKATTAYSTQESAVEALKIQVDKAYEYAKGRPKNEIITKQWSIMKDSNRNLLGGFITRWQEKGSLSKTFVTEAKSIVSRGFDQIIGLESGLIKSKGNE